MKFLPQNLNTNNQARLVYLDAQNHPEGLPESGVSPSLLSSLNLQTANDNSPVLQTTQESGSGISASDTVENFQNRVAEITQQGVDGVTQANLGGKFLSRMYVPPEFGGLGLYLLNPLFLAPALATPATAIGSQLKEAFSGKGSPSELLGNSPLLSVKSARALLDEPQMLRAIKAGVSGSQSKAEDVSLTSLQILESVNDQAFEAVNSINDKQAAEFFERSGYNLNSGERDTDTGTVWYKRLAWRLTLQDRLYRARFKAAKALYNEGHEQIVSNLKALKQFKEVRVFKIQQSVDEYFLPRQDQGAADTVGTDAGRKVIQLILNRPDQFISNPAAFNINDISPQDIFGEGYNPLDVIEALRAPNMEYITNKKEAPNYLESAITVSNWQLNHYNSLRTLEGLHTRSKALQSFDGKNLEHVESHLLQYYEPDKNFQSDTPDPASLNQKILAALGSAMPGELNDLQKQLKNGNIYLAPLELFWHIISFLGKDKGLSALKKLPPTLQGELAQFLIDKRTQLEQSAISGGIDEKGSLVFRAEALKQGEIVATSLENFAGGLSELGSKLISTEKGEAQFALREIATVLDNFKFFFKFLGQEADQDGNFNVSDDLSVILAEVPEYERSLLSNIINLYPKVKYLGDVYPDLVAERKTLEELIDQDPEWIKDRKEEYEQLRNQFKESIEKGDSGLSGMGMVMSGSGMGAAGAASTTSDGSGEDGIGTSSAGLEARWTAIRKAQERIAQKLDSGADGGAIGKIQKIDNYTFSKLPGNIDQNVLRLAKLAKRTIERRRQELGINDETIDALLDDNKKPSFALLAQNEMYTKGSEDIVKTAEELIANQATQQFANMGKSTYVGLQNLTYARADYQSFLTVQTLTQPEVLSDALYVRKDSEGGFWYHTANQIIRVTPPRFGGQQDRRNLAIWNKSPEEKGFKTRWTVPSTQPDHLGIFLTANPENSAGSKNTLYGPVQEKIKNLLAANVNFAPKSKAA